MVKYNRKRSRRTLGKRRRNMRMRRRTMRRPGYTRVGSYNAQITRFKRHVISDVGYSGGTSLQGLAFSLDQTPGYSDIVSLYDRYRIIKVIVRFIPISQPQGPALVYDGTISGYQNPGGLTLSWAVDTDDGSSTTLALLQERENFKCTNFTKTITIPISPRVQVPTYQTGPTFGYSTMSAYSWCDSVNSNIQYYGLKYIVNAFGGLGSNYTFNYRIWTTYYIDACNIG